MIYSRNITKWGEACARHLGGEWQTYDVVGLGENHKLDEESDEIIKAHVKGGWKPTVTPCQARGERDRAGGAVIAARSNLQAASYAHLAMHAQCRSTASGTKTPGGGPVNFLDFAALNVRTKYTQVTFIQVYMDPVVGKGGRDAIKMEHLGAFTKTLGHP